MELWRVHRYCIVSSAFFSQCSFGKWDTCQGCACVDVLCVSALRQELSTVVASMCLVKSADDKYRVGPYLLKNCNEVL